MTAVLSPSSSSPSPSPHHNPSSPPTSGLTALPPLVTNNPPKRSILQRPSSYAKNRMSSYSTTSNASQKPSRPPSHVFPIFHSSLSYALARDFAYPPSHPFHYGPPAESSAAPSGRSTPAPELQRRLSDPQNSSWETSKPHWPAGLWSGDGRLASEQLPQMAYGDDHGPPYSEDEDLHSPIVMTSRHKKTKSAHPTFTGHGRGRGRSPGRNDGPTGGDASRPHHDGGDRGYFTGINGDGSKTYYIREADETADGPGGELVTYPPGGPATSSMLFPHTYHSPRQQRDPSFPDRETATAGNGRLSMYDPPSSGGDDSSRLEVGGAAGAGAGLGLGLEEDDSRYSRDYQFTIASPDEEMHGKAVALFDFVRENENELPLVEGQVIWVSYRHGQGWLVAEDPKTRESGLVPEEYVRLFRDIEGGWGSLSDVVQDQQNLNLNLHWGGGGKVEGNGNGYHGDGDGDGDGDYEGGVDDLTTTTTTASTTTTSTTTAGATTGTSAHSTTPPPTAADLPPPPSSFSSSSSAAFGSSAFGHARQQSNGTSSGEKRAPVVSTFSTSSDDLHPYPHPLLGTQTGQAPPQVVHYPSLGQGVGMVLRPLGKEPFRRGDGEKGRGRGDGVEEEEDDDDDDEMEEEEEGEDEADGDKDVDVDNDEEEDDDDDTREVVVSGARKGER